jgi:DNA-binding NarL/FixJ family response regulator
MEGSFDVERSVRLPMVRDLVNRLAVIVGHCDLLGEHLKKGSQCAQRVCAIQEIAEGMARELDERIMNNVGEVRVTPRDHQILDLLVQGCSNREIGVELQISPRTVKQHLGNLFARVGILDGRKRVKLARSVYKGDSTGMTACAGLNPMERQISILVWEGLTNRDISKMVGISENMIKNHLRSTFDKLGVWSRLELAMYMASRGGKGRPPETSRRNSSGTLDRPSPIPDVA